MQKCGRGNSWRGRHAKSKLGFLWMLTMRQLHRAKAGILRLVQVGQFISITALFESAPDSLNWSIKFLKNIPEKDGYSKNGIDWPHGLLIEKMLIADGNNVLGQRRQRWQRRQRRQIEKAEIGREGREGRDGRDCKNVLGPRLDLSLSFSF